VAVAATRTGFFRSRDAGATWKAIAPALDGVTLHSMLFLPGDGRAILATTSGGLFRSDDRGETWKRVTGGIPYSDLTGIAASSDGQTIYISDFTRGGIFRSTDAGASWTRSPTDGLGSERVWTLAVDPLAPERVLAASSAGGLHLMNPPPVLTGSAIK
jgi:photosystem II stability/assembly factor-like uncharacterized protein